MNALQDHSAANLALAAPVLDEAINQLGSADRTAILLRFFEQCDFRAVGEALGSNEDAARMRVNRAVEKLHTLLKRRGVTLPAAALATALAGQAVSAAPAGLAAGISSVVLAGTAAGSGLTLGTFKAVLMAKLKLGIVGAVVVASVATPLVLHNQARAKLREQDESLRQQQTELAALQAENERLARLAASAAPASNQSDELRRLRAEAAAMQQRTSAVARLREENRRLKAATAKPQTPLQTREEAMAKMSFSRSWMLAFILYADKHQKQLPTDFEQAREFLPDEAKAETNVTTEQFEIVYQGRWNEIKKPATTVVVREKQAHQAPDGKWSKVYGFADGHSELHSEPDGNFEAWEKEHIQPPPSSPQSP